MACVRTLRRGTAGAIWLLALMLLGVGAGGAQAQGVILLDEEGGRRIVPPRPTPRPEPFQPVTIESEKVHIAIRRGAAEVEVNQVFANPNARRMEGTYLFALPEGAAVSNFRMQVGKEPVEGRILDAKEAREIYMYYVRRYIDPGLLEYAGTNTIRARIFPIEPRSEVPIRLVYSHVVSFEDGLYSLRFPLNTETATKALTGELTLDVEIDAGQPLKAIYSPSHQVLVERTGDTTARVRFAGKQVRTNRDFELFYSISSKEFGLSALAHRRGQDGTLMLMLAPEREVERARVQPKDVVLVFDTSGSMQGDKIEQARKALQTIVGALNERDRFSIVSFSSEVRQFREELAPANAEQIRAAQEFAGGLKAIGGTAIDDALQAGLAMFEQTAPLAQVEAPPAPEPTPEVKVSWISRLVRTLLAVFMPAAHAAEPEQLVQRRPLPRLRYLIFVTDGLPTIGIRAPSQILENAQKAAPADVRLFCFGVGDDVNTLLLDRLARDHRGDADYVARDEDLERKIGSFYAKIANPVLSDVKIAVSGVEVREMHPSRMPDLFSGTQLLVFGRYDRGGNARVTLTGTLNGREQRYTYDVRLPERETKHEFIPQLWAARRIGDLLEQIRLHGEEAELKDEVVRLSTTYGIITPYTSFLVEEPGRELARTTFFDRHALSAPSGGFGGGLGGAPSTRQASPAAPGARGSAGPPGITQGVVLDEAAAVQLRQRFGQQAGAGAVDASKALNELKRAELEGTGVALSVRRIEGRTFRYERGVWKDETAAGKLTIIPVQHGSEAWFKLLEHKPEWAKWLALGQQVTFRSGTTHAVVVSDKGRTEITAAGLRELER